MNTVLKKGKINYPILIVIVFRLIQLYTPFPENVFHKSEDSYTSSCRYAGTIRDEIT
jgi:hypothetical protein